MNDDPLIDELRAAGVASVRPGHALAELTTLRVGGPARALVTAEDDGDLAAVAAACREHALPWLVVGRGSNLLVADEGWPGVAIQLGRGFRGVEIDGEVVRIGAAEPMPSVAVRLADAGLGGAAWAAGIPGTVGGSVRMNAGAHGGEVADHLVEVELFRLRSGTRETWPAEACGLTYRHSELPDDAIVLAAVWRLTPGDRDTVRAEIRHVRDWRRAHQPINEPNCGSVFTNPAGDSAGRLVEAIGGKQRRVGGAEVSAKHANFIVTRAGATASDVWALVTQLRDEVERVHGVRLRPEVVVVGQLGPGPT
ncbi:UDP-N-acetylmuramate dehydrogenase [Nitriliruptoraceae bacterium ZYF776]|nr:UDP-N-acetylmuramate dehydrogenase [Profundirhabdus halotolerans]